MGITSHGMPAPVVTLVWEDFLREDVCLWRSCRFVRVVFDIIKAFDMVVDSLTSCTYVRCQWLRLTTSAGALTRLVVWNVALGRDSWCGTSRFIPTMLSH